MLIDDARAAFRDAGLIPPADLRETCVGWWSPSLRLGISRVDSGTTITYGALTAHATHGLVVRVPGDGSLTTALSALRDELVTLGRLLSRTKSRVA
ncbi:MAG: hypothetical protein EKK55_19260 [Rhodocyclaceae bacterium]|nr:MAG: hypothetical protein EKK55_19260 [Rhodocyclaceae bacterium]